LTAVFLLHLRDERTAGFRRWGMGIQAVLVAGCVGLELLAGALGPLLEPLLKAKFNLAVPLSLYWATAGIGIGAALTGLAVYKTRRWIKVRGDTRLDWAALITMTTVLLGGFFLVQDVILEAYRPERTFARELKSRIAGITPQRIGFYPKVEANLCFYLQAPGPVRILRKPVDVQDFMASREAGVLICQRRHQAGVDKALTTALPEPPDVAERIDPWISQSSLQERWVAWMVGSGAEKNALAGAGCGCCDEK